MSRPIILHYHLFKNAGTSVDEILKSNFGPRWRNHDQADPAGSVFADEIAALLTAEPELAALSSHQFRPPLPNTDRAVLPIVFLRHPIDRIRSIYTFDRKRGPVTPAAELACHHEFPEYVSTMLVERPDLVRNAQTMLLTDAWDRATRRRLPIGTAGHFERATVFLASLAVVGVVEEYERSWAHFLDLIRPHHPGFAVDVVTRHNVDEHRAAGLEERLAQIRSQLGEALYDELHYANSLDLGLRRSALERLAVGDAVASGERAT
jgi:hypothetical protein